MIQFLHSDWPSMRVNHSSQSIHYRLTFKEFISLKRCSPLLCLFNKWVIQVNMAVHLILLYPVCQIVAATCLLDNESVKLWACLFCVYPGSVKCHPLLSLSLPLFPFIYILQIWLWLTFDHQILPLFSSKHQKYVFVTHLKRVVESYCY